MILLVDFDGTCVTHEFPNVGQEIGATPVLKQLVEHGNRIILFTVRANVIDPSSLEPGIHLESGQFLDDAVQWFKDRDIPLYGINENPEQKSWSSSPKPFAHILIDDTALGCPLVQPIFGSPYVDWEKVAVELVYRGALPPDPIDTDLLW